MVCVYLVWFCFQCEFRVSCRHRQSQERFPLGVFVPFPSREPESQLSSGTWQVELQPKHMVSVSPCGFGSPAGLL